MSDGLKAKHRAAIIATLAANHRVEQAVLFGSRAMGTNTVTSDVDIALFGHELTLTDQANLAAACEELPMAQSVDLVLHSTIDNPALVEHIRSHGVEWYRRGGGRSGSEVGRAGLKEAIPAGQKRKMGSEWKILPLCNVTENHDSKRVPVKESDRKSGIYPYYGASGIVDYVDSFIFDGEYVLVAEDGENLRSKKSPVAFFVKGKFWVNNHAHILSGNRHADTRFLSYMIESCDISGYLTGSTIPKLTQRSLGAIEFLLPPLPEQKAIAHILGTLDDKIELNRKTNETLEAMARALFKSWFVDFDPVRAKAEGRSTRLPDEIGALFPDSFEDSELGEIPRGWGVCSMGDLLTLERDSLAPGDTPEETFSHYSIPAFDNGKLPAKESGASIKSNKYLIRDGVFLVSKLNPKMPRVWLPSASSNLKRICSTEFLVCRPSFSVGVPFGYLLAKSSDVVQRMGDLASGTSNSHQRIRPADFMSLSVIKCDDRLLKFFNESILPLLQKSLQTRRENLVLSECRDVILPKLVSGDLRVSKARIPPGRMY